MEAPANAPSPEATGLPRAELVVVNGRLSGVRRPLVGPMTLLGRATGCEIRLNADDVQPLHAALVYGQAGFFLRDLTGEGGVLLNDQPATLTRVEHGDVVGVGSFRFRLQLANPSAETTAQIERNAVRIQAAAVAAQQSALNEEEMRLEQRRIALDKQEEQLAIHLEERRGRLLQLQEQTRQERETFQTTRIADEKEQAARAIKLQAERDEAAVLTKRARTERQHLIELRKRMLIHGKRRWKERETVLARREKELTTREDRVRRGAEKMARDYAALVDERLRLNGELELGKRQLRERWQELGMAQQQWEACLNQEHAERESRSRDLDARTASVEEAERTWSERERSARLMLADLHREGMGLEARIGNLREKLVQQETAVEGLQALHMAPEAQAAFPLVAVASPLAATGPDRTDLLQRVAGRLADQRAHLLEQWQTLLRVQEEWRTEREQAMVGLETAGRSLQEQEHRLLGREREIDAVAMEWRQRQQALTQARHSLEGWQARLTARETAWECERATLLSDAKGREEAAEQQLRRLRDLARRREVQRAKEAEGLAAALSRCEDLRRQYVALWKECQQRRKELTREQCDLAARTLALEQIRRETVAVAPDAAGAERRMKRLRRREILRIEASEKAVEAARKDLAAESDRLDELAERLHAQQKDFAVRLEELIRQQAAWEEREAEAAAAEQRRRLELQRLTIRREQDERQIAQLRDEVERVAGVLMNETETVPASQAA
jgi:pSer/pThr/pTyr-binding forkhead associated (FHA) protein